MIRCGRMMIRPYRASLRCLFLSLVLAIPRLAGAGIPRWRVAVGAHCGGHETGRVCLANPMESGFRNIVGLRQEDILSNNLNGS